jgi:hypothetical protein
MPKLDSRQSSHSREATGSDVHQILGDVDDGTALAILALRPTVAQLEEASVWLNGAGDVLGRVHRPLDGIVAEIFDMLRVQEDGPPPPGR